MRTVSKAALLLMSAMLLPQASLAGKPTPTDCEFEALETACTMDLKLASMALAENSAAFVSKNADKDYFGLRCKVAASEIKMSQDKPFDALRKLDDSFNKIWTLLAQRKIDSEAAAMEMAEAIYTARSCVEAEATK